MSKLKVAIILISPGKAGVESVVRNILRYMDKDKIEFFLINNSEIASYYNDLIPVERRLVLGRYFGNIKNGYLSLFVSVLKRKLKWNERKLSKWSKKVTKFLDKHSIKLLHAHLVWDYWIASKIKENMPEIVYINTMHGTLSLDPADNYFPYFKRKTVLKFLSNADAFTSACHYFIRLLELWKVPVNRFSIISNGIDRSLSNTSMQRQGNELITICFMGGGRPDQKGGDILLYALYILVNDLKITNFRLLIYGEAHLKEKELAEIFELNNFIEWRGFVEPPYHLKGMQESDIFVLPSRHEGVANTLMEAIGMELAIVATKIGGTPEVIFDGKNGMLCYPESNDLAAKLAMIIRDSGLANSFRKENKMIKEQYYWETICNKYADFYSHLN